MDKRNLKLLYFSTEDSEIKTLNLGFNRMIISILLGIFSIIFFTTVFSTLFIKFYHNYKISQLRSQNTILIGQFSSMEQTLSDIQTRMKKVQKFDNDLRTIADLPKLDEGMRDVGTGGTYDFANFAFEDLSGNLKNKTRKLNINLSHLERQIDFQLKSFMEIYNKIEADKVKIQHTPSIRPIFTGRLKSKFGKRRDPFVNEIRMHNGLDIAADRGTPVYTPADGVVIEVNNKKNLKRDFGRFIKIDHGYGIVTLYGHLSKIDVKVGQRVRRKDKIGEVGRSGRSTGNHLHYGVAMNGKWVDPMNFIYEW
ncbi:MAG TPA: M23 family metallopeptidase [Bacteroidetes bacterium]|nr:M23 family metallopeptidase [Bacteroidota bacterium]